LTVETLEQAWLDQAGAAPMTPVMAFGPDGLTLGAGTVLAPVEDLEAAEAPGGLDEARLFALLSAAYRQPIKPQALRYIRRGAASWRAGDKAMAAMHLAMTGLMPLRDMKGAARRLFMADALMKAGTEPDVILRALDLPGGVGEDALTRYDSNEPRNPAGSGRVSGRWTREGAAVMPQPSAKPVGSGAAGGRGLPAKPAPAKPAAAASPATRPSTIRPQSAVPVRTKPGRTPPPSAPVKAPPIAAKSPAAIAAEEGAALLENPETFAALASLALRFSGPTVFFSVLLIPSNRTTPDKIPIPGHPDMHLERRIGDRLWTFVYKDQAGVQRHVLQGDDGLIRTVEGRIVGRIDLRNETVVFLAAVNDKGESEHEPKLCPAAEPDRPGQGPTGTARDYENRVKAVVNKPPTPNAVAYYLLNPDSRDGRVSFDDCQQQTGIMIEAKGPGYEPILKEAEARLAKNNQDKLGRNVIDDLIRQGVLQVDAARISKNRPIVWFCHSQDMIDIIKGRFQKYKKDWKISTFSYCLNGDNHHEYL